MSTQPLVGAKFREFDANGLPLAGGLLYTYAAGTTTPQATYTDSTGSTPNANPVVLDAAGRADVWLTPTLAYKLVLKDSLGNTIYTEDNFPASTTQTSSNAFTSPVTINVSLTTGVGLTVTGDPNGNSAVVATSGNSSSNAGATGWAAGQFTGGNQTTAGRQGGYALISQGGTGNGSGTGGRGLHATGGQGGATGTGGTAVRVIGGAGGATSGPGGIALQANGGAGTAGNGAGGDALSVTGGNGNGSGAGGNGITAAGGTSSTGAAGVAGQFSGTAGRGAINLVPEATPSAPVNGDIWVDSSNNSLSAQVNGGTVLVSGHPTPLVVGSTGVAFQNSFLASAFGAPRYWIDGYGVVHLSGGVTRAASTIQAVAFTLPAGYRPAASRNFPGMNTSTGAASVVTVAASGTVGVAVTNNGDAVLLDGITFETF